MNNIKRYTDSFGYYTSEKKIEFNGHAGLLEIDWMDELVNNDLHVGLFLDRQGFFRIPGCDPGSTRLICRQWRHHPDTECFETLLYTNFIYYNRVVGVIDQDIPELETYKPGKPK
ncbi:MAG: hypothetical protein ACW99G_19560, partial [Candidatus Thorarchaeota archaeon]